MMEAFSSQSRQQWEQPPFGSHESLSLIRRRGAIIDALSVKNDVQLLHSGSQFVNIILDAPGSVEIERRCHFGDNEILKDVLTTVTKDYGVDLSKCQIVALSQPDVSPDISSPATNFANQSFLIVASSRHLSVTLRPEAECICLTRPSTVEDCIAYFSCHGLKPLDGTTSENTSSALKLRTSLGFKSWEDLLDQETVEDLTEKEEDQQEAIWELIYTEHSHLTQLAVVINVFMRCLEYMQSIDLLTEVNYHNIFGHMRDLYEAHEIFWNTTLLPCLQKAADNCKPLDVDDLITQFPQFSQLFEPYEHHCIFEVQNLQALDDAMNNADFNAYIKWCEGRPDCKRLRLKDFLAKPMQRLTKYPLLLKAILSKTSAYESRLKLQNIISTVNDFVSKINSALRHQDEVEKVKVVSQRLATTCVVRDVPSSWEKYLQPYLQLDLLAPMSGVNLQQQRTLIMEGALRYKEDTIKLDVNAFLFTDMLLITRASKKSPDQLVIVKTPYKIDSLIVKPGGKDPAVVDLACLNDLKLVSTMFSLKATTPQMATSWIEGIQQAQQIYYQLRCNYESQPQYQQQQQQQQHSPMLWSTMSQPEVRHATSLSGSDYFSQSTCSVQSIERHESHDSFKCHNTRKPISLSPPIIPSTTKDISTQTDDKVQSLLSPPELSNEETPTKQCFFKKISAKRSSSYDSPHGESSEKTDEKALSSGSVSLRRDDTLVDNNTSVRKHKRSKSLKLTELFK